MMLIVLDKDPFEAARLIPKSVRHTQLKELMQMISCVVDFGYKQLPQGKRIKEWISKNPLYVYYFALSLSERVSQKETTRIKYKCLMHLLFKKCSNEQDREPTTGIFRYVKEYNDTIYPTDTELPIDECISEYKKYVEWKGWK